MELGPISASLGAMGSLAWKLDELLATRHRALRGVVMDEIEELITDLHILHNLLLKLSNEQDPPPTARYWMKDVRDLSYDMEDCADQFVHADACAKIRRATRRKIITRLKINRLPERRKWRPWITNKVSEFRTRAHEAVQRYWRYKFDDCASNPGYSRVGHELPTLYTEPGDLVGMEGPMNELDRWLTNGEEQLKVVSIVGVGGVGKTTLAQKLWGKLQGQFDCRAFVRTAQKPDMRGILRSILSQVRRHQPPGPGEMPHLIHELRQYLQAKRYFVIIDDLWATSVWDVVSRAFPEGNCCSRIITTTEIMEVALACCGYCHEHIFKMEPLSDDDSEKLLLQRILVSENQSPQNFDDVLSQITRKCGGLPLAIIILGSLLASQPEKLDQWGLLQNSFGSNLQANPTMEGFVGQILNISFNSLPHYLKTCLLYLSTYPEGYIFLKDDLVKLWVAESFICAKEGEDMEKVAGSYFDELVSTGLIQVDINYNYELLSYSVHHMVLDLITYRSIEENFITIVDYSQMTTPLTDKVRRLSLHFGSATYATTPASTRLSQVRSLFFFGLFNCMPSFVVFKLLRVLKLHFWGDLENTSFNLTEICELFQLRYLQVTCNVTVKLPDQIEAMKHLETLEINARVCVVPPDIVQLSSLLHLCLRGGTNLPDGIGCMRSLRTLKYFDIGNNSEDNLRGLGELKNLRDLHLTYSISPSSEHLKRNLIALASSLGKLGNLKSLTLTPGTAGTVVLIDGLDGISNPVFLERLELLPPICIFSILPTWFAQLDKICIMKVAVRELPRDDINILAGLPSLAVLSLCVQTAPEGRIIFNNGAFPVLKYFKFSCGVFCMSFMSGAMPNLRRLKLCFNTHIGEKYSNMLAGIEHLLNLQDITGRIGAATESDRRAAESAIKDVISKHPRCPRFNVQRVDPVEEEYCPLEKQHGRQEKGSSGEKHGVIEKAEDTNKHEDSGHQLQGASLHNDLIAEDPNTRLMDPETKELYFRSRIQEEEILSLRKQIADASLKELQLLSEKHILERKLSDLRMAVDEKQEDTISGALKQLSEKKNPIEENMRLANELKVEEEELYLFTSSLLGMLAEYNVRPPQICASTITTVTKHLYQQMQWKIRSLNDSLGDITQPGNIYNPNHQQATPLRNNPSSSYNMEANRITFPQYAQDRNDRHAEQLYHGSTFNQDIVATTPSNYFEENAGPREVRLDDDSQFYKHDNQEYSADGDPLPGIEGLQIFGEPRPGLTLRACGFPTNGTTLCNFQWVRYLENGTRQSIEGATMYDYVVTADDVGTLLAVDCTPMDDNGRQGYLVREFANNENKITCDPNMQSDEDMTPSVTSTAPTTLTTTTLETATSTPSSTSTPSPLHLLTKVIPR